MGHHINVVFPTLLQCGFSGDPPPAYAVPASCSLSSFPLTLPCFDPSLYLLGYFLSLPQYSLKTGTTSPFSLLTSIVQAWYFLNKDSVHFYKVKQNITMTTICGAMCARQATKCFTYFILFNPYSNPVMW